MKKILALAMALCLVFLAAVPVGALSIPAGQFNDNYYYMYIDYNEDGSMELATFGGEPSGYTGMAFSAPVWKFYTNVDGEAKEIVPTEGSVTFTIYGPSVAKRYENRLTGKQQWYSIGSPWFLKYPTDIYCVIFDFSNMQYSVKPFNSFPIGFMRLQIRSRLWSWLWKQTYVESYSDTGILTPERIEELLLNPPVN